MSTLTAGRAAEFLPVLEERLPEKTFRHVQSVAQLMLDIRDVAGISKKQAVATGLLHDLCKAMKPDALLAAAADYGIEVSPAQRERPGLLHGPVAAEESKRTLDVDDPDVYDAMFWHTTGRPGWNPVGVAIYFADFSEPLRVRPEAGTAREILAQEGYAAAVRYVVTTKLSFVEEKYGLQPDDVAFRKWIMKGWSA